MGSCTGWLDNMMKQAKVRLHLSEQSGPVNNLGRHQRSVKSRSASKTLLSHGFQCLYSIIYFAESGVLGHFSLIAKLISS